MKAAAPPQKTGKIRTALRRSILDRGHIEIEGKQLRVFGDQGRLIAEFTPSERDMTWAMKFWRTGSA